MTVNRSSMIKSDVWITDSAASTHITNSNVGLYDYTIVNEPVKIGDGKLVYAKKVGKLKVFYKTERRDHVKFILDGIQYIPNF